MKLLWDLKQFSSIDRAYLLHQKINLRNWKTEML